MKTPGIYQGALFFVMWAIVLIRVGRARGIKFIDWARYLSRAIGIRVGARLQVVEGQQLQVVGVQWLQVVEFIH